MAAVQGAQGPEGMAAVQGAQVADGAAWEWRPLLNHVAKAASRPTANAQESHLCGG